MKYLVTLAIASRNDSYMGDYKWRVSTGLNYLARNLRELGRLQDVEVMVCDWNSEIPLHQALPLSESAAQITKFIVVPQDMAVKVQGDSTFPIPIIINTAIRRAGGEFVIMVDADTLFTQSGLANLFRILERKLLVGSPIDQAYVLFGRRQMPVSQLLRRPNIEELDRFVSCSRSMMKMDPFLPGLGAPAGAAMLHRSLWHESRGYNEKLINWGWMDIDLHLRLTQRYQWVDLANFGVDMVHLEHYTNPEGRAKTPRKLNPMLVCPTFTPNGPDWGLGETVFPMAIAENIQPEVGVLADADSEFAKPLTLETMRLQMTSPLVRKLIKDLDKKGPIPRGEELALIPLAWHASARNPRVYVDLGVRDTYTAALVASACPGTEIYGIDSWQPEGGHAPLEVAMAATIISDYSNNQHYVRMISGDPATALPRIFEAPGGPKQFDLAFFRTIPSLGDPIRNALYLADRMAPGGAIVVSARSQAEFIPVWEALRHRFPQNIGIRFPQPDGSCRQGCLVATTLVTEAPVQSDFLVSEPRRPARQP